MRKTMIAVLSGLVLVLGWVSPVGAATPSTRGPSGPVVGTVRAGAAPGPCSIGFFQEYDLTVDDAKPLSLELAGCAVAGGRVFCGRFDGSFVLRAFNGATLTGSASGSICGGIPPLSLTLTAEGGTRQLRQLTGGQLRLDGEVFYRTGMESAFTGALAKL